MATSIHERARAAALAIEAELKHMGRWAKERPVDERFENMGPFGMNTLAAEEWLQFVLIPRVIGIADAEGSLPKSSDVSTWAARNFDGDPDATKLLELLRAFDALFG